MSSWHPALRLHNSSQDAHRAASDASDASNPQPQDDDADFFHRQTADATTSQPPATEQATEQVQPPATQQVQPQEDAAQLETHAPSKTPADQNQQPSQDHVQPPLEDTLDPQEPETPVQHTEPLVGQPNEEQMSEQPDAGAPPTAETPASIPEPTHHLLDNTIHPAESLHQGQSPAPVALASEEPDIQEHEQPDPVIDQTAVESEHAAMEEPAVEESAPEETAAEETGQTEETTFPDPENALVEQYEYQGETTAADEAVDESGDAPLLQDEQDPPTPGFASDAPAVNTADVPLNTVHEDPFALPQPPHHAGAAQESPDAAAEAGVEHAMSPAPVESEESPQQVLHMVADLSAEQPLEPAEDQKQPPEHLQSPVQVQSQSSAAFDWGDDDPADDFGAVVGLTPDYVDPATMGNQIASDNHAAGSGIAASQATAIAQVLQEHRDSQQGFPESQDSQQEPLQGGEKDEDDLAAMWAAALDDDELLDESQVDPSGFFPDDDEGLLEDFDTTAVQPDQVSPGIAAVVDSQGRTTGFTTLGGPQAQITAPANRYTPQPSAQQANPYQIPSLTAVPSPYNQTSYQQQPPQRPALASAQSFVDRSKGGYSSPYDLPEDIVQTRRRPAAPNAPSLSQPAVPLPPPRSSSMTTVNLPPNAPPPLSRAVTAAPTSTAALSLSTQLDQSAPKPASAAARGKDKPAPDFFAELPIVPKPRTRPSGTYAPVITSPSPPVAPPPVTQGPPPGPPSRPPSRPMIPLPTGSTSQALGDLRQPERMPLLPDTAPMPQQLGPPQATGPPATSRYSPAVPLAPSDSAPPPVAGRFSPMPPPVPAAASRYSPASQVSSQAQSKYAAAPPAAAARPAVQPFAPRTSSPLAYQEKPASNEPVAAVRSVSYQASAPARQMPPPAEELQTPMRQDGMDQSFPPPANRYASPPRTNAYAPLNASPESRIPNTFSPVEAGTPSDQMSPPRRPHTQSPGAVMKGPLRTMSQIERSISAAGTVESPTIQKQDVRATLLPARRQFSADLSYAAPQDERAADPLERYKGCPIFKWGPSGSLISTFPKQAPFYAAGHAIPTIKCTPGSVTIHDTKSAFPMDDRDAKFPGPLKPKSKKKEVLSWLTGKIEDLERVHEGALLDLDMPILLKRRVEEKVVLWKMVKLTLEHDNKIEGNAVAEDAARKILLPNLAQTEASLDEVPENANSTINREPVSAQAVAQIRKHLLEGQREKAVWYAAEQRLWSHALLIASVAGPEIWKQVVQEFVRAQVKDAGENSQSLAALYEVFAGNWEESIDELVPPSARAGFQMISKAGSSAKNPLEGLDQWRETLGLIISNRSNNDTQAIAALGKLLSSYGRSEAAHTCFLFARASVTLGGADDPNSDFVLLGADHKSQPQELAIDLDAILLTEVYELTTSFAPVPGTIPTIHHLQAYKFQHAQILAEHGLRDEAQSYCSAITAAFKASTRTSPYYHPALMSSVDDLSRCLSQAPQTSSSGWIPKPSMDKVSGSVWKRFNNFVAGEDDDQKPAGAAGTEGADAASPFARITGDTPTVSRTTSVTDLYGAMAMNGSVIPPAPGTSAPSKYAPMQPGGASAARYASNTYAPSRGSMESSRSYEPERPGSGYTAASSMQSPTATMAIPPQRASSTPFGAYMPHVQPTEHHQPSQSLDVPRPEANRAVSDYRVHYSQPPSRRESVQSGVSSEPRMSLDQGWTPYGYQPDVAQQNTYQPSSYTPSAPMYGGNVSEEAENAGAGSYAPPSQSSYQPSEVTPVQGSSYEPPVSSYEPSASSYESPAASYEPPQSSYEPPASYEPPESSYNPPTSSYEPPASSGYEPPGDSSSYQPYEPEPDPEQDEQAPPPKKKSIIDEDEDDDMGTRSATFKKAEADKAADEAFRKAAEADAERDKQGKDGNKKGWFGGWFGGKKDPSAGPGPIRAKLGEESSFYYDPDLKKWVNKKGGPVAETSSATPPPPRGPATRNSSANLAGAGAAPPSGPPSRTLTPASAPPSSRPPSGPPSMVGSPAAVSSATFSPMPPSAGGLLPPSGPPSRPATSMSNASSIDDLLGAPAPRKGGTTKGKKRGGRYVDVMAK